MRNQEESGRARKSEEEQGGATWNKFTTTNTCIL